MNEQIKRSGKTTKQHYIDVFQGSVSGEMVLQDLLRAHSFYTSTIHQNELIMAAKEGERNVVLRILTILDSPDANIPGNEGE